MLNLSYTIARENLIQLGFIAKGIAIGVAEFGMKTSNTIFNTKIWKEFKLHDKNEYNARAGVTGYQFGFALPFIILMGFILSLVSTLFVKAYIAIQVTTFIAVVIYKISYPLTKNIVSFYNREVHYENQ